jgi:hypothetical protein
LASWIGIRASLARIWFLILVLFKEKGNSMLKIIKQSKLFLIKVIKHYKKCFSVWGHLKVMATSIVADTGCFIPNPDP